MVRVVVSGSSPTVWVHALDGDSIKQSRRLLLTHLTDVQGDGAKFADESMKVVLKWGERPLVRNGTVKVALKLDKGEFCIYALDTAGRRVREVSHSFNEKGWLRFDAVVAADPENATLLYEIIR